MYKIIESGAGFKIRHEDALGNTIQVLPGAYPTREAAIERMNQVILEASKQVAPAPVATGIVAPEADAPAVVVKVPMQVDTVAVEVTAPLGSPENPMTEAQATASGIDVEKVKAEAEIVGGAAKQD